MKKYDKPELEVVFYNEKDNIMLSAVETQRTIVWKNYTTVFGPLNS